MKNSRMFKFLGALALVAGFIGGALAIPPLGGTDATSFEGSHEVSISGPSTVNQNQSATYAGTIQWTGSVPPEFLGVSKYVYFFTYQDDSGSTRETPRRDTNTSQDAKVVSESINLGSNAGSRQVCFVADLVWNGGSERKQDCTTTTVRGDVTPPPQNEICGDGIDNDHDGQVDENCSTPQQSSVDLRANPTVISSGGSSTLTWTPNFGESGSSSG